MALTAKQKRDQALREEGAALARAEMEAERETNADIRGGVSRKISETNLAAGLHPDQVASAHGEKLTPQYAGEKVIVACKLGVAYFNLQLCKIEDKFEQNMQGGRMIKEANRIGPVVQLRGTAYPRGTPPKGFPERPEIVDGAALNRGIDRGFMETWLDQNRLNPIVINHLIFVAGSDDAIKGQALEHAGILSGLEPINPTSDQRISAYAKSSRPGEVEEIAPGVRGS